MNIPVEVKWYSLDIFIHRPSKPSVNNHFIFDAMKKYYFFLFSVEY